MRPIVVHVDPDRSSGRPVLERVPDQVREQLRQPISIPPPLRIRSLLYVKATAGSGRLGLLDHLPNDLVEIACAALDGHPTTEAGSREVEALVDYSRRPGNASGHSG